MRTSELEDSAQLKVEFSLFIDSVKQKKKLEDRRPKHFSFRTSVFRLRASVSFSMSLEASFSYFLNKLLSYLVHVGHGEEIVVHNRFTNIIESRIIMEITDYLEGTVTGDSDQIIVIVTLLFFKLIK